MLTQQATSDLPVGQNFKYCRNATQYILDVVVKLDVWPGKPNHVVTFCQFVL